MKRYFIFIIKLFLSVTLVVGTYSQAITFQSIGVSEGLPQSSINDILQDKTGFIWIATNDGLARYDSQTFKVYRMDGNNGLGSNVIAHLYQDAQNILWLSTNSGVYSYNEVLDQFTKLHTNTKKTDHLLTSNVNSIVATDKSLWFTIDTQPYQYQRETHQLITVNLGSVHNNTLQNTKLKSFVQNKHGDVWLRTENFLYWLDPSSEQLQRVKSALTGINISGKWLIKKADGRFNFYSEGILWCHQKTNLVVNCGQAQLNIDYKVNLLLIINEHINGDYWLGIHGQGLYQLNQNFIVKQHFKYQKNVLHGLNNNDVGKTLIDRQNNIWLITYGRGLNKIPALSLNIKNYGLTENNKNSLSNNHVRSFYQPSADELWVGTLNGLNHLNLKSNIIEHYFITGNTQTLSKENFIRGIINYDKNNLLIMLGTSYKKTPLWLFNINTKTWLPFASPQHITDPSSGFDIIKKGDNLWLALVTEGLFKFDINRKIWSKPTWLPQHQNPKLINKLYFDHQQRLWIGDMTWGAFCYDFTSKKLVRFNKTTTEHALNDNWVKSFLQDSQGNMWIGTANGLHKYDETNNTFKLFTTKNGLTDNTIYGILEDKKGSLWLSTNAGINRYNPTTQMFDSFHQSDGFQGEEYNSNAYLQGLNGDFYFGGINGFDLFDPQKIDQQSTLSSTLLISNINIFNKPLSPYKSVYGLTLLKQAHLLKTLNLSYQHQIFSLDITQLDFSRTAKVQYQYRLKGLSEHWLNINNNTIDFTGLAAGHFLLQLKKTYQTNPHDNALKSLIINISPPWWQSTMAYFLYVVAVVVIFSFIYWRRVISLKKQTLNLQHAVQKRTKELKQALAEKENIFSHISHEFRTPLTLINGPAADLLATAKDSQTIKTIETIQHQSRYLLRLVNQLLGIGETRNNIADHQVIAIDKQLHHIASHFQLLTIAKQINFVTDISPTLLAVVNAQDIDQIFSNLLSNAIKFTPTKGKILLKAYTHLNDIICRIEDSGCGIINSEQDKIWQKFYRGSNNKSSYLGTGLGLALVKNLVAKYYGDISLSTGINGGCCFTVRLPSAPLGSKEYDNNAIKNSFIHAEIEARILNESNLNESNLNENSLNVGDFIPSKINGEQHQETLLIVDDNLALQRYLTNKLTVHYHCLLASNGKEGIKIAVEQQPDLIISDIMMPLIDGYELCETLKNNVVTSHIPLILLTAKNDQPSKIKGLQNRANLYLSKPFDFTELSIYIFNLLKERKFLKQYYQEGFCSQHNIPISITDIEQKFIDRINKVLEKHYTDPNYQSSMLASELALSERQLQRKFKAIADITPSQFIRQWRLKKSKPMLLAGQPIGNVALDCGFNSQAYFTKCFKESFNETPSIFIENN
ncbi:MAG: hypothetical protein COB35_13470 [Gammaproteobacteria bacterium]|nr:MAG: hypothetical protein COB35_13470 [Gammaproteobacteria bacterium]